LKKAISLTLDEQDLIELIRVIQDEDAAGALAFLKVHIKGKARELLEGG